MQAQPEKADLLRPAPSPRLLALPSWLRGWQAKLALALLAGGVLALFGYLGALQHPENKAPQGSQLEARIAAVFGQPKTTQDDRVIGDYLVERFYIVDVETGDHYVADVLKGRITDIQANGLDTDRPTYTLLLDQSRLSRDRALYAAYVDAVAPPEGQDAGDYLGLRAPAGINDAFYLNYDGTLPDRHEAFKGPNAEGIYDYLISQSLASVNAVAPRIIGVNGYNYLLNSTDWYPYLREFGINKAIYLAETVIVDGTAQPQETTFIKLLGEYLPNAPR